MPHSSKFKRHVASGYGTIMLLLTVPAAVAIGNAYFAAQIRESATVDQIMRLQRAEELGRKEAALTTAVWTYTPQSIDARRQEFITAVEGLGKGSTDADSSLVAAIEQAADVYLAALDRLIDLQVGGSSREVKEVFNTEVVPRRNVLIEDLEIYMARQGDRVEAMRHRADTAFMLMLIVPSTAFIIAIAASVWFARRSIRELRAMYEREQEATEEARQAVADREELQGILAHDLRSPLNAIAMQAGVIQLTGDLEEARKQGRAIERVTKQMSHLMQTLLDAGRIREGRFSVDPEPVDAREVLDEVIALFEPQAGNRTLRLELPEQSSEIRVMAERERLVQVISNLVSNALRFTPDHGRITISADVQTDALRITVSDSGCGIDPEHLPRIFDRHFTHSNGSAKGTGLGLYITRSIIEAHGGEIWVDSAPGEGASFHFTVPVAAN